MAYREVRMMDIDQVIRRWLAGEKIRAIARLTGSDRNTVRRIVRLAEEVGIRAGTPWPENGYFVILPHDSSRFPDSPSCYDSAMRNLSMGNSPSVQLSV
jgi:hypothetical protein